jgi:hypothetical protein
MVTEELDLYAIGFVKLDNRPLVAGDETLVRNVPLE